MADNPDTRPGEGTIIPVSDSPHAPFIFYESAPISGFASGVVNITMCATRTRIEPDGALINDQVVVAYLCGNIPAAINLRRAIDNALLLAVPAPEKTN